MSRATALTSTRGARRAATKASTRVATDAPSTMPATNAGAARSRSPVIAHTVSAMPPQRNSCTGTSENVSRLKNACGNDTATAIVAPAAAQGGSHRHPSTNSASNARPPTSAGSGLREPVAAEPVGVAEQRRVEVDELGLQIARPRRVVGIALGEEAERGGRVHGVGRRERPDCRVDRELAPLGQPLAGDEVDAGITCRQHVLAPRPPVHHGHARRRRATVTTTAAIAPSDARVLRRGRAGEAEHAERAQQPDVEARPR